MENREVAISLKGVSKTFSIGGGSFDTLKERIFNLRKTNSKKTIFALKDINIEIYKGECIGIIGHNGSGKSTLTKIMSGAFIPDSGGAVSKIGTSLLLNLGVGFSHELTARENILVNGSTLGLSIATMKELTGDILDFAEIADFADTKIKYYSTGMIQRLSFSIAIYAKADIIFLDEVFAVGDAKFRDKAVKALEESWLSGKTSVIVSHNPGLLQKYCKRIILMEKGEIKYFGDPKEALELYGDMNSQD